MGADDLTISAGEQPRLRPTRSDGSPCTAGVAQHTCSRPLGGDVLVMQGMHITHAAPHLPRGVDPVTLGFYFQIVGFVAQHSSRQHNVLQLF